MRPDAEGEKEFRPSLDELGRSILYIDDTDFVTFHNLLYFLYTGHVNLNHHWQDQAEQLIWPGKEPDGWPEEANPTDLFRAADMYLVEPLRSRCLRFLVDTCTINNISERLFDISFQPFEDLKKGYLEYMVKNFDKVKKTKEWREAILQMNEASLEELKYQHGILLEITTSLP